MRRQPDGRHPTRWVVLGAGGIGGGLGGALARAGESVHLVARGAHLDALRQTGLRWRTPEHDEILRIPASPLDEVEPLPGDVLCLATKLQDARPMLERVAARWDQAPVTTWTNGLLAQEWAAAHTATVVATVLFVPASHDTPGEVCLWGEPHLGAVHAGTVRGLDDRVRDALVQGLRRGGFDAYAHDDLGALQHAKWTRNLAGAAQALVVPADFERVAESAISEGRAVLRRLGWPLATDADLVPTPLGLGQIQGASRGGGSTWQSLTTGRPLETPYLNGALVDLADAHGLDASVNRWLARAAERAMREAWRSGRLRANEMPGR